MQKTAPSVAAKSSAPVPPKKKFKFTFSVGFLNILLFLGIIGCIIALSLELRNGFALLNQSVEFPREAKTAVSLSDIALPSTPRVEYYLRDINGRNIFKPYVPKVAKKAAIPVLQQLMSKYKLVGIAWLDVPETATVMIENTQKNTTFFLKAGEQLEGVTVKTIYTDRAVFSHENEETTIKL